MLNDTRRQELNARSTVVQYSKLIARGEVRLDRELSRPSGYSVREVQRIRNQIKQDKRILRAAKWKQSNK